MAKIKLPEFRYLCQDLEGYVWISVEKPYINNNYWVAALLIYEKGKHNLNWQNTLIDLETDDYDYTDGILTRIEK